MKYKYRNPNRNLNSIKGLNLNYDIFKMSVLQSNFKK